MTPDLSGTLSAFTIRMVTLTCGGMRRLARIGTGGGMLSGHLAHSPRARPSSAVPPLARGAAAARPAAVPACQPGAAAPGTAARGCAAGKQGEVWAVTWTLATPGWAEVRHPDVPRNLLLRVRVAPTGDGLAAVAAQVERTDGRPLTAQDLRRVKLPPAWVLASSLGPQVASPRPGPRGKGDDHWRAVYGLWVRAQQVAPHTPVRWMLTQWQPEVSDATMRRWVKRARERAAINHWEVEDHE